MPALAARKQCIALLSHTQVPVLAPFPEQGLVYDYVHDRSRLKWLPWLKRLAQPSGSNGSGASEAAPEVGEIGSMIVPTLDTLRYTHLLDALVTHHHHCLFVGPTGTGKTVRATLVLARLSVCAERTLAFRVPAASLVTNSAKPPPHVRIALLQSAGVPQAPPAGGAAGGVVCVARDDV